MRRSPRHPHRIGSELEDFFEVQRARILCMAREPAEGQIDRTLAIARGVLRKGGILSYEYPSISVTVRGRV